MSEIISKKMIDDFQELGVSFIPKLFKKHIDNLRKGIEFNIFSFNVFVDKVCNVKSN